MDENKNQIDQHKLNQNGMKLVGAEAGDPVEREAGNQLPSLDFLGEVDLQIGGVTLWHGRGAFGEPYFRAQVPAGPPAWYPFVYYRVAESYDGDGWIVRCEHNGTTRALILHGHPFLSGRPLPELLAAVAVLARERVNLFQELDRPWNEAREFDYQRLETALQEGLADAQISLLGLNLDDPEEPEWRQSVIGLTKER